MYHVLAWWVVYQKQSHTAGPEASPCAVPRSVMNASRSLSLMKAHSPSQPSYYHACSSITCSHLPHPPGHQARPILNETATWILSQMLCKFQTTIWSWRSGCCDWCDIPEYPPSPILLLPRNLWRKFTVPYSPSSGLMLQFEFLFFRCFSIFHSQVLTDLL